MREPTCAGFSVSLHPRRTHTTLKILLDSVTVTVVAGRDGPARHAREAGVGPAGVGCRTVPAVAAQPRQTRTAVVAAGGQVGGAGYARAAGGGRAGVGTCAGHSVPELGIKGDLKRLHHKNQR
jgi:hypothetical protein